MPRLRIADTERFWSRVQTSDKCWLWTGSVSNAGYGQLSIDHIPRGVHRLSWEITNGPIPHGMQICHHCDVRLCVRPSHLFLGTQADNIADKVAKGRQARGDRNGARTHPEKLHRGDDHWTRRHPEMAARGERVGGSKLTDEKVRDIRRLRLAGWTLERLADEYGVAIGTVHFIVTGKTWRHLL